MLSSSRLPQTVDNQLKKKNHTKYVRVRRLVQLPWKGKQEIGNHCHHWHWKVCAHTEHKCLQKCLYVQNFISISKSYSCFGRQWFYKYVVLKNLH